MYQVYLVEIADTERRGIFGASGAMAVSVGITLTYCLGVSLKKGEKASLDVSQE
jgi:hypothetical protein